MSDKKSFPSIDPKCPKHSSKRPSSLNSTILNYYHQYGQHRDLERFLRLRPSSSGSMTSSFSPLENSDEVANRCGKSLENLNILQSCLEAEKSPQKSRSAESLDKSRQKSEDSMQKVSTERSAVDSTVKLISKKASKSKKKYNINTNTSIEITLPQTSQQQMLSTPVETSIKQADFSQQKIEFGIGETQTEAHQFPKTPNNSDFDIVRPSSASSSVSLSNKQLMEWDSMADIGYTAREVNFTNLTAFEREALQQFFAARGINFDDEMVVFASKTKKISASVPDLGGAKRVVKGRNKERWEVAFRKILEEKYRKKSEKFKETTVDGKKLWELALKKFRQKYGTKFNPETDPCITIPTVHSTPIPAETTKEAVLKVLQQEEPNPERENIVEEQKTEQLEKACQTSFITMSSKECQVEQTAPDQLNALQLQGISSNDNSKEDEKSADEKCLISAGSFEFFAPEMYNVQDKENIPPWNKENVVPQEIQLRERKNLMSPTNGSESQFSVARNTGNEQSSCRTDDIFGKISNLDNDLAKGVEILWSLVDSKELDEEKRKKLVRKIIRRMIKAKYDDSTASSHSLVSSTSQSPSGSGSSKSQSVVRAKNFKVNVSGIKTISSSSTATSSKESSISSARVKSSMANGSNSNENSMKDWLQPMTHSERNHQQSQIISKQKEMDHKLIEAQQQFLTKSSSHSEDSRFNSDFLKFVQKQKNSQPEWLDEAICHLVNLKKFFNNNQRCEMDMKDKDPANRDGIIYENITARPRNSKSDHGETALISCTNANTQTSQSKCADVEKDVESHDSSSEEWNSHVNMQQMVRNRTKLETPNEDIATYAHAKQQEFIGKYESIRARPIYTQPYSSDHTGDCHYSEPRDRKTSSKKTTNDAYTSITVSDAFLSSDSVSIAVANSTSNTTTHQYDTRASVGIQTTNSLTRTFPIFNLKCKCESSCHCVNKTRPPTIRVKAQTNEKQLQVIPRAISYELTFKGMTKQRKENRTRVERSLGNLEDSSSTSSSKDYKKNVEKNFIGNFGGCAKLSLQEHLKSARPDFVSQADERRNCLIELQHLREKRNEQRNRLFLLSSNHSLRNHVNRLNPPPMAVKRIFTTKGLKQQTRNRYNKLPEVVRKEEIERQNRIKRSNRIIRDMFNKNLQKRVLKGQTDLSNSVFIAAV